MQVLKKKGILARLPFTGIKKPAKEKTMEGLGKVKALLTGIYGETKGEEALNRLIPLIEEHKTDSGEVKEYFSEEDIVLITYGDSVKQEGEVPLGTFHKFANKYLKGAVSTVHFLPFFPYSSDDGFSVMDFFLIDPELGVWDDVEAIHNDFGLMFDHVLNHFSSKGQWFKNYLAGKDGFKEFAIEMDPSIDLSQVTRPRALPLLTEYKKDSGETVHLWTTFSEDQIDFNFQSLDVLEQMIKAFLVYAQKGATIIRLDAIAFLWKEIGTTCLHLQKTHDMVKVFRAVYDLTYPEVIILTETNVPHKENVSYFGNGVDEAQMVYNFTLPPLLFYSFVTKNTDVLTNWAKTLTLDSTTNTFFNFTASHDGIGVRPLEGILPPEEVEKLIGAVNSNGGRVSYKDNPDGSQSPYELNITYVDALKAEGEDDATHAKKFLAAQSVQYALPGVPASYIHSIMGSHNWQDGVEMTGRARTINRAKLDFATIEEELADENSFRSMVFRPYIEMIKMRKKQSAFHPNAGFAILELDSRVFGIKRYSQDQLLYALTNVSNEEVTVALKNVPYLMKNLFTGEKVSTNAIVLKPYEFAWITEAK